MDIFIIVGLGFFALTAGYFESRLRIKALEILTQALFDKEVAVGEAKAEAKRMTLAEAKKVKKENE